MRPERFTHKIDGHYNTFAARDAMCGLPGGAHWSDGYWWVQAEDYKAALVIAVKHGMKPRTRQRRKIRGDRPVRRSDKKPVEQRCPRCGLSTCSHARNFNEPCDGWL